MLLSLFKKKWRRWLAVAIIYIAIIRVVAFFSPYYAGLVKWSLLNDEATIPLWIGIHIPSMEVLAIAWLCSFIRTFISFYCIHMERGEITPEHRETLAKRRYQWLLRISQKYPDAGLSMAAATPVPVYALVFLINASKSRIKMGYAVYLIQCGNTLRILWLIFLSNFFASQFFRNILRDSLDILQFIVRCGVRF